MVGQSADLSITKSDGVTTVTPGDGIARTYTIIVSNAGPSQANSVVVTDTWPVGFTQGLLIISQGTTTSGSGGNFTWNVGSIANGGSVTLTVTYTVPSTTQAGSQTNTATVSSSTPDPTPGNNTATDTNAVSTSADLSITKSDGVTTVTAGDGITRTYTIMVINAGPSQADNVVVTDTWPVGFIQGTLPGNVTPGSGGNFTWNIGTLVPGASITILVTYTVPSTTQAGSQTNTAVVSSSDPDPTAANNIATDTNTVIFNSVPPTVTINKAGSQDDPTFVEPVHFTVVFSESVTGLDASDISFAGSTVSGTLVANVSGSGTTYDVSVTGITSAGNVVASLPAGAASNSGNVTNLASTSTDNVVQVIIAAHDLSINKNAIDATVIAGTISIYPVRVTYGFGPPLQNVTITDVLPPGTRFSHLSEISSISPSPIISTPPQGQNGPINIMLPSVSPFTTFTFSIWVFVDNNVSGNLSNTASVSTYLGDINPSNNSSTISVQVIQPVTITCPSNLSISTNATNCVGTVDLGNLNYVITGPSSTLTLSWRPEDDPAATITSTVVVPGTATPANFPTGVTTVTATVSNGIAPNASCQFTVTVIDNTPPQLICPGNKIIYVDNDCYGHLPDYRSQVTVTDNCSDAGHIDLFQEPGFWLFSKGETKTIRMIAFDAYANQAECTFTVTALDTTRPKITCPANVTKSLATGTCTIEIPINELSGGGISFIQVSDNCYAPGMQAVPQNIPAGSMFSGGTSYVTWTVTDASGNTNACVQSVTVLDIEPPTITNVSANPVMLWPPNHKMKDVTVYYTSTDNCGIVSCRLEVSSNEPINGTGDGDTDPDWEIIDDHHVKLRAERAAHGDGRIYTITIICSDEQGNETRETVTVTVAHNITSPGSGQSFKIGSTVSFAGTFWDKPGNKHTAKWLIDNSTATTGTITEPLGSKNGKVTGSYKFNSAGVYKLQMNVTDQNGVTSYANTNEDLEAIVVIYDPNGGYTYGGGYYDSPAGALLANPSSNGKASYGFAMNYFKNSTNPKGETQFEFKVGEFEFNALNFDYLVISNSMSQFKGTGKIIGGQSGIGFTMTVTDGQLDGTGVDKIRMKIYNKNNGKLIYDNQRGASDAALPLQAVGTNSIIVISGTNSNLTSANTNQKGEMETKVTEVSSGLDVIAFPNPSASNFTINVKANSSKEKITMQVVDMYGRIIETRNVNANSVIRFGDRYKPGTYFVRIIQGKEHKEMKLIKLSN